MARPNRHSGARAATPLTGVNKAAAAVRSSTGSPDRRGVYRPVQTARPAMMRVGLLPSGRSGGSITRDRADVPTNACFRHLLASSGTFTLSVVTKLLTNPYKGAP